MRFAGCRWSGVEKDTAACKNLDMFVIGGKDVSLDSGTRHCRSFWF